jgi:hypothetical protein
LSLAIYPDPKDYPKFEELMLVYSKAYGKAEIIRQVNEFMNSQDDVYARALKRINEKQDEQQ